MDEQSLSSLALDEEVDAALVVQFSAQFFGELTSELLPQPRKLPHKKKGAITTRPRLCFRFISPTDSIKID